jgi:hypothetical protein
MTVGRVGHRIGGKTVPGASGRTAPVRNPATGDLVREVALASAAEVDADRTIVSPWSHRSVGSDLENVLQGATDPSVGIGDRVARAPQFEANNELLVGEAP